MGSSSLDPDLLGAPKMGDMADAVCMADHFDKIQKLPDPIPGAPNFRRVPGFKVYCCGQPTIEGFEKALEKVCCTIYPKDGPIIWFNLRQEPTVYVNGTPICARPANKIGEYAELGGVTRDIIKEQEKAFLGECEGRKSTNGGKLKIVDVNKKESEVEVKEFQISASFEGLVETVPGVTPTLLKTDRYVMDPSKDALFRGEFEVVKDLMATMPDGAAAKNNADKIIDLNGTKKTGGTGIKQLRENIAESKLSYEIMDDAAQAFLKSKIMD